MPVFQKLNIHKKFNKFWTLKFYWFYWEFFALVNNDLKIEAGILVGKGRGCFIFDILRIIFYNFLHSKICFYLSILIRKCLKRLDIVISWISSNICVAWCTRHVYNLFSDKMAGGFPHWGRVAKGGLTTTTTICCWNLNITESCFGDITAENSEN